MPNRSDLPYRDCVGIALFNAKGQVFAGRRRPDDDPEDTSEVGAPWQMPQGGIDPGESPVETAVRELFEETSVRSVTLLAEAPEWIFYDLPDEALGHALGGKYRGQRQRWFAYLLTGPDSEVDVINPGGGQFPSEFNDWRWETFSAMPDLVVPFKRDAYLDVIKAFAHLPAQIAARG